MSKYFTCFHITSSRFRYAWGAFILLLLLPTMAFGTEADLEEEIETLELIEITGTVVEQAPRSLNFSDPHIPIGPALHLSGYVPLPQLKLEKPHPNSSRVLLDQASQTSTILTPVKPLNTERPPYPRRAREQGWHGRVIVRLDISPQGTVEASAIHKSSGYELLDNSAVKSASQWTFEPAKNGAFPVATIVNIPIQFDLEK